KRLRQYPMDFGRASIYMLSVDEPEVAATAPRLLARLGVTGLVEVEFKRDARSGVLNLLDVNLRVWGWHTIGDRAGVGFAYLLWRALNGFDVSDAVTPTGIRWMRMATDLPVALQEIVAGRLPLSEYARSFAQPRERVALAGDDMVPALIDLPGFAYRATRRLAHGKRPRRSR